MMILYAMLRNIDVLTKSWEYFKKLRNIRVRFDFWVEIQDIASFQGLKHGGKELDLEGSMEKAMVASIRIEALGSKILFP